MLQKRYLRVTTKYIACQRHDAVTKYIKLVNEDIPVEAHVCCSELVKRIPMPSEVFVELFHGAGN
jgi:hypothetical protein